MSEPSERRPTRIIAALLFAGTVIAFGRTTSFDYVSWDDTTYVQRQNHVLRGLSAEGVRWAATTLHFSNWHPLTWISYMADVSLFGGGPGVHHGVNVVFHAINTVLLFLLLRTTTGRTAASAFAAALFALHPLRAESVAWISERKDVLSAFFGLLAMLAYTRYARSGSWWWYGGLLLAFACSLASKAMLVTLPCVLLLLDYWPLARGGWRWRVLEKMPLFAMAFAAGAAAVVAQSRRSMIELERLPLSFRFSNAITSYALYLRRSFWPSDLCYFYPMPESIPWWEVTAAGLLLTTVTAIAVREARRRPYLVVGWLWFLGTLFPVIGFLQAGLQRLADRYTYFPGIGLGIAVCWLIDDAVRGVTMRRVACAAGLVVVAVTAGLTVRQTETWRNSTTLFERGRAMHPDSAQILASLGSAYVGSGRLEEGIAELDRSLELRPGYYFALHGLGVARMREGRFAEAEDLFERAVKARPSRADVVSNLALARLRQGKEDEAVATIEELLEKQPEFGRGWTILHNIATSRDEVEQAAEHLHRALEVDPFETLANRIVATRARDEGRFEEAAKHFRIVLIRANRDVTTLVDLGYVLEKLGRRDEALAHYRRAIAVDDEHATAWMNAANVLAGEGALPEAARYYRRAIELDPKLDAARQNLQLVESRIQEAESSRVQ